METPMTSSPHMAADDMLLRVLRPIETVLDDAQRATLQTLREKLAARYTAACYVGGDWPA